MFFFSILRLRTVDVIVGRKSAEAELERSLPENYYGHTIGILFFDRSLFMKVVVRINALGVRT